MNDQQPTLGKWVALAMAVLLAVVFVWKFSILSVGTRSAGHIAVVWKGEGLADLRPFDSDHAACERKGARGLVRTFCKGSLAGNLENHRVVALPYMEWYARLTGG